MNSKTSIFIDCHVFDKGFEGTRSYIQGLYLELIKENKICFYIAASNIETVKNIFGEQENIIYLKYISKNPFFRLLFEIPFLIKKHKIDFAHFQYRAPILKMCKYIVTTHDVLFEDFPEDFPLLDRIQSFYTYKYSAKKADIVFTVSEYSRLQIKKHLKVQNVVVIPNGIDSVFFDKYDKDLIRKEIKNDFNFSNYIICVSRFEPRKNQQLLLKLYVQEKHYLKHDLVFIGNKTFENIEFDEIYNSLSLEIKSKVKFIKGLDLPVFSKIIKGASLAVYPSRAEGFGIPPLESIAANVTTICSNVTAMSDFDFFEEYAFNPNKEQDFIRALNLGLDQEDFSIAAKANFVREKYNWHQVSVLFFNELNSHLTDF